MSEQLSKDNHWDKGIWSFVKHPKFDFMTLYIMEQILSCVSFENKTVLELGAGTGRLSYLALKNGAKKVTLVDSSERAIALSKQLFKSIPPNSYNIICSDIFNFESIDKFDIVFSSGLIEHFKNDDRLKIIEHHVSLSSQNCVIVHPSDTVYAVFFNNFPLSKRLYGFQKSFSINEIDTCLNAIENIKQFNHKRFHLFYTVPLLHNREWLNRRLDKTGHGERYGGLTLTCITIRRKDKQL